MLPCYADLVRDRSGNGTKIETVDDETVEKQTAAHCEERAAKNRDLLASLREDKHSEELVKMCVEDTKAGRMSLQQNPWRLDLSKARVCEYAFFAQCFP